MVIALPGSAPIAVTFPRRKRIGRGQIKTIVIKGGLMNPIVKTCCALALAVTSAMAGAVEADAKGRKSVSKEISGAASWYGGQFHGRKTANGERYNMNDLTAAHRSLPFGTKVRVTNTKNGKSVVVRINDRGPYVGKRVIDLSRGAAQKVSMIGSGVAPVRLEVIN